MNDNENEIPQELTVPPGGLRIATMKLGSSQFDDIEIDDAEGAAHFLSILREAHTLTRRRRFDRSGQLYPETVYQRLYPRKLSVEIRDYVQIRTNEGLEPETIDKIERTLALLLAVCGDVYVSAITQTHVLKLQEFLNWTPQGLASIERLKTHSAEELIAQGRAANLPPPADATLDLHRRLLKTFFKHLVDQGILPTTPMVCWKKKRQRKLFDPKAAERLFSNADLQTIFKPENFDAWASKWPHRWWGPILGLYTGARINEVAQLRLEDIVRRDDTWWMHIRATIADDLRSARGRKSRASVKCASSIRCIPIAQAVIDAGFLDFIADLKDAGHARLFPNLSAGMNQKTGETRARYGVGLSNQFGAYMRGLGFPRGVRFHAFRHTFVTELSHCNIPFVEIASITGHALTVRAENTEHYGHTNSPKRPAPVVEVGQQRKIEIVAAFQPPVTLPGYARGQFRECLRWGARVYP